MVSQSTELYGDGRAERVPCERGVGDDAAAAVRTAIERACGGGGTADRA